MNLFLHWICESFSFSRPNGYGTICINYKPSMLQQVLIFFTKAWHWSRVLDTAVPIRIVHFRAIKCFPTESDIIDHEIDTSSGIKCCLITSKCKGLGSLVIMMWGKDNHFGTIPHADDMPCKIDVERLRMLQGWQTIMPVDTLSNGWCSVLSLTARKAWTSGVV